MNSPRPWAAVVCLAAVFSSFSPAFGQTSEIEHWDLALSALDADVSSDDHFVAVTSESGPTTHRVGEVFAVSLELWDYRQDKIVARARLTSYRSYSPRPRPVRFTADGALLAVADGATMQVLDAPTLKPVRLIKSAVDPEWEINSIETSPIGHLAIIATGGYERSHLFAYDLDTGRLLFRWDPPRDMGHPISWKPDGTQVAIAASRPCSRLGSIHCLQHKSLGGNTNLGGKEFCFLSLLE